MNKYNQNIFQGLRMSEQNIIQENILQDLKGYYSKAKSAITQVSDKAQFALLQKAVKAGTAPKIELLNKTVTDIYQQIVSKYPIASKIVLRILSKRVNMSVDKVDEIMNSSNSKTLPQKVHTLASFFDVLFEDRPKDKKV